MMRRARSAGFTLVEMLAVVVIVGILASMALPLASLAQRRAQEAELRQSLRMIRQALDDYKRAVDDGRVARAPDASGWPPNLQVLVDGVADLKQPGRTLRFLRRLPRDPFADRSLPPERGWALRSHDSPPDAPQEGDDVFDVASRSSGLALDGSRYDQW